MLLLATHFIEKDKSIRNQSKVNRPSETARRRAVSAGIKYTCDSVIFIYFSKKLNCIIL